MKILVEGRKGVKKVMRFECGTCGCVFLADRDEYQTLDGVRFTEHGAFKAYVCVCPTCNDLVYSTRDEETIEEE